MKTLVVRRPVNRLQPSDGKVTQCDISTCVCEVDLEFKVLKLYKQGHKTE